MHLSSLTLTNVRQFDQRTFEFQPGFNLIVGENGTGKTTILRGLLAALGGTRQMGRRPKLEDEDIRLRTRHAEVRAAVRSSNDRTDEFYFRKTLWKRAERSSGSVDRPLVLVYASNEATCSAMRVKRAKQLRRSEMGDPRRDEEFLYEMEEKELARRKPNSDERLFGSSQPVRKFVEIALSSFAPDFQGFHWRFEPYDCSLLPPEGMENRQSLDVELQRRAKAVAMRFFQENWPRRQRRPYEWPDQAKVVLKPEPQERKLEGRYLPDLRQIWDGMKYSSEAQKYLQSCSLEVKLTPRIMIRGRIGPLSLSQLSDGEQRLFSLFVDIARQLSLQDPHNEIGRGEAIVLIDEIDVHLHPKWQRKIVPALEDLFRGCQFIATTHSPFVVQAVAESRLQHIERGLMGDISHRGIEDIAVKVMGIEDPQVSVRYLKMLETAREYFRLLGDSSNVNEEQRKQLKGRLRTLSSRYADNPAYQAYLEIHGQLKLGPDELR